ncbi:MAG: hypothetical protein ACLFSA_09540 [Spirochaetaceae bacterium]
MTLFLILTMPCAGILYIRLLYKRSFFTDEIKGSLLYGAAAYIIALGPVFLVHTLVPFSYTPSSLYVNAWLKEFLVYWIAGLLLLTLMRRRVFKLFTEEGRWAESAGFWTGFLIPVGICIAIVEYPSYSPYTLFLFPVLLLILFWVSSAASFLTYNSEKLLTKILAPLAGTVFTLAAALVPYFFSVHYHLWGYLFFIFLAAAGAAGVYTVERFFPQFHKTHTLKKNCSPENSTVSPGTDSDSPEI